jgi:predicted phage replisome organizer
MSANIKKYYWIKLKTDFFNQREVKKLRRIAGGDTYTIIYLKLQLLSAKADGVIRFDGTEENLIEQLELELDEDANNIGITLAFLQANNLMEQIGTTDFLLSKACDSIGKEGTSAERVRKHRNKQKALHCNTSETNSNTEIEIEKEIELKRTEEVKPKSEKLPRSKPKGFEYPEEFEKLWASYKHNNKGDKWNGFVSAKKRFNDGYKLQDLYRAIKLENKKDFAKRNFSTILNGDIDEDVNAVAIQPKTVKREDGLI